MNQECLKAAPFLTVSEAEQARRTLTAEREGNEKWKNQRLENSELKETVKDLRARQSKAGATLDAVVGISEVAARLKAHSQQPRR